MKRSEIYRRAAELVNSRQERYSCIAIAAQYENYDGCGCEQFPATKAYLDIFKPQGIRLQSAIEENKNHQAIRILMLCLAAAIAESEGK